MKPNQIKKLLLNKIQKISNNPHDYCINPNCDFYAQENCL